MATDKDFRVKNGLVVAENISADGNISINGTSKIYVADSEIWDDGANFKLFGTNQTQYSALGQFGAHIFYTKDGGSNSTEVFKINHQGNITLGNNRDRTVSNSATAHDVAGKDLTISAGDTTAGTTDNIAGGDLILQGGQGKGTGAGGSITFQVADGGSTGSTLNSLSTAMTIADDGKVGIGTTDPDGPLHIYHTDNTGVPGITIETAGGDSPSDSILRIKENHGSATWVDFTVNTFGQLEITGGATTRRQIFTADDPDTDDLGVISLNKDHYDWDTQIFGDSSTPVIYVDGTNNRLGVGTTTPSHPLHVIGNAQVSSSMYVNTLFVSNNSAIRANGSGYLLVGNTNSGQIRILGDGGTSRVRGDANHLQLETARDQDDIIFAVNAGGTDGDDTVVEAMRIDGATKAVNVVGAFSAATKSFDIEHPTKEGMRLHHGSLEGPEHGVYVRGRLEGVFSVIDLPDYWTGLVDEDSITVQLTPNGGFQQLYVEGITENKVYVKSQSDEPIDCFYFIQAERKDVGKMEVEY